MNNHNASADASTNAAATADAASITIELIGSDTARHVESGLEEDRSNRKNRGTTKSPIGPLCRKLIEAGHDPAERVHIIRKALDRDGYIAVFKRDRTLAAWAGVDCIETERRSPHVVKHRALSDAVIAKKRRETPEVTEGSSQTEAIKIPRAAPPCFYHHPVSIAPVYGLPVGPSISAPPALLR